MIADLLTADKSCPIGIQGRARGLRLLRLSTQTAKRGESYISYDTIASRCVHRLSVVARELMASLSRSGPQAGFFQSDLQPGASER